VRTGTAIATSRRRRAAARIAPSAGTRERIVAAALIAWIVAAALIAFADAGFDGATTRDIAAAAGVNQGLITYHFAGGKDALWKAAIDFVFEELRGSFATAVDMLEAVDARTRLRLMIRQFVRFSAAHPELHRLIVQEGKSDGPRLRWLVDRHVRPLFDVSLEVVRGAQADGVLSHLPAIHLHYIVLGAAAHLFVVAPEFERLTGIDPTSPASVEAHVQVLTELLLGREETR
jgi:TetR/AcrR family transcriptional regulator